MFTFQNNAFTFRTRHRLHNTHDLHNTQKLLVFKKHVEHSWHSWFIDLERKLIYVKKINEQWNLDNECGVQLHFRTSYHCNLWHFTLEYVDIHKLINIFHSYLSIGSKSDCTRPIDGGWCGRLVLILIIKHLFVVGRLVCIKGEDTYCGCWSSWV
jgi:hypothetical protein